MILLRVFFVSILFASASCASGSEELKGVVAHVYDGDTIDLKTPSKTIRVRLAGIDAPETDQPGGKEATDALQELAYGKNAVVLSSKMDRYGRTVGKLNASFRDCYKCDVNLELIKSGNAWWYRAYSAEQPAEDRAVYEAAEANAKREGVGLWSQASPIPPWEWRRGRRHAPTPSRVETYKENPRQYACGAKRYCKEMRSCSEALYYLEKCGLKRLDGDSDGVPCESLCR